MSRISKLFNKFFITFSACLFLFVSFSKSVSARPEEQIDSATVTETLVEHDAEEGKFNAGKLVIGHISDEHEWHLWGSHEEPVSIPLPIILYNKEKGFSCFMSSNFEHGHATYDGYKMEEEGIVSEDGSAFYDFSITKNVLSLFISLTILLFVFISVANAYSKNKDKAPSGLQSAIEPIILFVRDDIAKAAIGEKNYARFMPYLLTIFFFIWVNNLLGLIPIFPGGANVTGNIAIPLILALFTLAITLYNGNKHYWKHIVAMPGVPVYVLPVITLLEILGIFLKPFVLMVRLFANIMAGHIVILVFFCLIFVAGQNSAGAGLGTAVPSVAFTIFINALELLVGFLQAFVFTFLSAIYFGMAVAEPEHH